MPGSCIFMACVYVYVIILTFLGPEYKGRKMDAASDHDLQEARGIRDDVHENDRSGSEDGYKEKV
jgi:MFS transporter, SHS family, lactate transporter